MATLPYMKLYVGDYLKDTGHLTTLQHGAYMLLLFSYWSRGCLPDDDSRLATTAKMTPKEWRKNRDILAEFFSIQDGKWVHGRVEQELGKARERSAKAAASVRTRYERTTEKPTNVGTNVGTNAPTNDLQSHSSEKKPPKPPSRSRASGWVLPSRFREDFDRVWKAYPRNEGKQEAEKAFAKANPENGTVEAMLVWIEEAKQSDQWQDKKLIPHLSTMLNKRRWEADPPPCSRPKFGGFVV